MPDDLSIEVTTVPAKKLKRFWCQRCEKQFSRLEHLQRHDRTHTQERPFPCLQCASRFTRSDLLIRHERLSHNKNRPNAKAQATQASQGVRSPPETQSPDASRTEDRSPDQRRPLKRPRPPETDSVVQPLLPAEPDYRTPLECLSIAAEQSAFEAAAFPEAPGEENRQMENPSPYILESMESIEADMPPLLSSLDVSFDNFSAFLETDPLLNTGFSGFSTNVLDQPTTLFPFHAMSNPMDRMDGTYSVMMPSRFQALHMAQNAPIVPVSENPSAAAVVGEEQTSFSRFGSRLPSLQPQDQSGNEPPGAEPEAALKPFSTRRVWDLSLDDRRRIVMEVAKFETVPRGFQLPTRMALARYIRAYVSGFHDHLPFLHVQSMTVEDTSVELLLAMAAVGAQYCVEAQKGVELFHAAQAIASERIRRRDFRMALQQHHDVLEDASPSVLSAGSSPALALPAATVTATAPNGPLGLPSHAASTTSTIESVDDLMQSAQALLILMAMATWAKHREILREALAIQSVLASIIRDDGLEEGTDEQRQQLSWEEWVRVESVIRTKYIVFCFFNLHSIVYDIPPLLLNSELRMRLPGRESEFKAQSAAEWREAIAQADKPVAFQDALQWLFARDGDYTSDCQPPTGCHSALGNYVLIHAIIQDIFLVRQTVRGRAVDGAELTAIVPLEQALRRWELYWKRCPESSIDPSSPHGPVAFNATALLRLAYIRLNMDTGPGRALGTRDPQQIALALCDMPAIRRTATPTLKLVRALLHAAHALSIPVKIGVRLVAKTQAFVWSIQHALCSLECALFLCKWLETVALTGPQHEPPLSDDERRILSLVRSVLAETEFAVPPDRLITEPETARHLSAGVLRVWATIFRGAQTWAIVDVIGSSLNTYANILAGSSA